MSRMSFSLSTEPLPELDPLEKLDPLADPLPEPRAALEPPLRTVGKLDSHEIDLVLVQRDQIAVAQRAAVRRQLQDRSDLVAGKPDDVLRFTGQCGKVALLLFFRHNR